MWLSDTSVRRPVLATVLSALLVAFGLLSFRALPLRELPDVDPPIVSVVTEYRGASASVVENRVTRPIEDRLAGIEGIRTIESRSREGVSEITIEFELARDIEDATNDVRDRVSQSLDDIPKNADAPQVYKAQSDARPIMWLQLRSEGLDTLALTDYAERRLVDRISVVNGVARVILSGGKHYSMRIWLDRIALDLRVPGAPTMMAAPAKPAAAVAEGHSATSDCTHLSHSPNAQPRFISFTGDMFLRSQTVRRDLL